VKFCIVVRFLKNFVRNSMIFLESYQNLEKKKFKIMSMVQIGSQNVYGCLTFFCLIFS
jgi:hypothetical protein